MDRSASKHSAPNQNFGNDWLPLPSRFRNRSGGRPVRPRWIPTDGACDVPVWSGGDLDSPAVALQLRRADRGPVFLFQQRIDLVQPRSKRRLTRKTFLRDRAVRLAPDDFVCLGIARIASLDAHCLAVAFEQID